MESQFFLLWKDLEPYGQAARRFCSDIWKNRAGYKQWMYSPITVEYCGRQWCIPEILKANNTCVKFIAVQGVLAESLWSVRCFGHEALYAVPRESPKSMLWFKVPISPVHGFWAIYFICILLEHRSYENVLAKMCCFDDSIIERTRQSLLSKISKWVLSGLHIQRGDQIYRESATHLASI